MGFYTQFLVHRAPCPQKNFNFKSFLAFFIQKTRWETIRVIYQKNLLKSLNKVLYQFNFNELAPEKELIRRYSGIYNSKTIEPNIKSWNNITISYANESLYLIRPDGREDELVQFNDSLFYVINWNLMLDFSSADSSTNKVLFQFIDRNTDKLVHETEINNNIDIKL